MRTLWEDFEAFLQEHRRCGGLDAGVEDEHVWMKCEHDASLARPLWINEGGLLSRDSYEKGIVRGASSREL
jgi:hypothetical protein